MSRTRIAPALGLVAALLLTACSSSAGAPASPSTPRAPSVAPSVAPPVSAPPSEAPAPATPAPTKAPVATPPPATPRPFTEAEKNFLPGIQRGADNCVPVDGDDLPENAALGVECDGTDPAVDRVGFYLFEDDQDMIDGYRARMAAEGVDPDSGTCADGEAEHAYWPGEEEILARAGCFLNDEGYANYRYTVPGDHVYVGILGNSADMRALEAFAWKGNLDVPGMPTLWFGGID